MWFEIVLQDGVFGYQEISGDFTPVVPAAEILPDWKPIGLYLSPGNVSLLEFKNADDRATWFLDKNLMRIAGSVRDLTPEQLAELKEHYRHVIAAVYASIFVTNLAADREKVSDFLNVAPLTRREIASACQFSVKDIQYFNIENMECQFSYMGAMLSQDFQECILAGAPTDSIHLIDPTDGELCGVKHGIALDDFRMIYLLKARSGDVFWICVSEHSARIVCAFDPVRRQMHASSEHNINVGRALFGNIVSELYGVCAEFGDVLPLYLQAGHTQLASFLRPPPANHLGHQLWNELSGVEFAVNRLSKTDLPYIVVPSWDRGTETFAPIEKIFPELHRKIIRLPASVDFRRYALIRGLTLVKLSASKVSKELRARINVQVASDPAIDNDRHILNTLIAENKNIILLGLRVENRTISDLKNFVRNFARRCSEWYPNSVIVLDGHNSQRSVAGKVILASHGQWGAKRQPIEVEMELADILETECRGKIGVINLIGEDLSRSLFWSLHSHCFITIWGAGLAKYRWVANSRGFVITSAWNRLNRPDLGIYSSEQFMDTPEEMSFISADDVHDEPEAEQLVKFNSDQQPESYHNFSLKDGEQLAFLRIFLDQIVRG